MKKISFAVIAILTLFASSVLAQDRVIARATVPFSFSVHDKTFAAGTYDVRQLGAGVLRMENKKTWEGVTIIAAPAVSGEASAKLVFRQYGAQRFLSAIVAPAGAYGAELSTSNMEREVARSRGKAQIVAINMH